MTDPFDLNLRHLRALDTIVGRGGLSAAADAIGLSQPALTQGLVKLEGQLGAALFERRPDGMTATAEGRRVAERSVAAFGHLAQAFRTGPGVPGRRERLATATQARAFLALADAGSFTGAGLATGISQPAIHRAVRELELLVGVPLVERRGRGVALSPAGRRMARGVRLARSEIAAAIAEVRPGHAGGRLAVGAMPLSRAILVPRAASRLLAEHRDVELAIVEGSWLELVEPLRDGVLDVMIGALRGAVAADLCQTPLLEDRPVVVASARHPLAVRADVEAGELARYPWIVGRAGSPLRAHWESLFPAGAPAQPCVECGSVMVVREMLVAGDYLALLSPAQVALEVAHGVLAHVRLRLPPMRRTIGLVTRASWRPTAAQQRFVELLAAVAGEVTHPENE